MKHGRVEKPSYHAHFCDVNGKVIDPKKHEHCSHKFIVDDMNIPEYSSRRHVFIPLGLRLQCSKPECDTHMLVECYTKTEALKSLKLYLDPWIQRNPYMKDIYNIHGLPLAFTAIYEKYMLELYCCCTLLPTELIAIIYNEMVLCTCVRILDSLRYEWFVR